tara:strand:+ start:166 stop:858 length:693 start_codon:yes stop_codon:yes gene_type:complete
MDDLDLDGLDLSLDGLDLDLDTFDGLDVKSADSEQKYFKPKKHIVNVAKIKYENADKMAVELGGCNGRTFALLSGSFIFGDLIEAIVVRNNWHVKRLVISTLSLSIANIESLRNLIVGGYVDKLDLVVSDYFYSHERNKLIKDIYERLDIDGKLQLTVANTHTKIVTIETHCGRSVIMHGSANLRSSGCTEQVCIEDDAQLTRFYIDELIEPNIEYFSTIGKSTRIRGFL